jgi:hypothetical protein
VAVASTVGNTGSADQLESPDSTSEDGFIAVSKETRGNPRALKSDDKAKSMRKPKTLMIGVRDTSILPVVSKRVKTKALFVSRFSPEVSSRDIEKFLKEQLKLSLPICTRLKTEFKTYASFHISVTEDNFSLIYNTGVWPDGCLIPPFYGRLNSLSNL